MIKTKIINANKIPNPKVKLTLDPPWTTDWISEDALQRLEEFGIARSLINFLQDSTGRLKQITAVSISFVSVFMSVLARQVVDEVRAVFDDLVFQTVIPRNIRLGEAPSHGKPIFLYDIRSRGADAYFNLEREFLGYEKESVGQGPQ